MDKLKKSQKDEFATSFAILTLYDGGVSRRQMLHDEKFVFSYHGCWRVLLETDHANQEVNCKLGLVWLRWDLGIRMC